jgi:hypothetical protein
VVFDDTTNSLDLDLTFSGLTGNTTAAHIHCCSLPTANAGVASPVPTFPGFLLGVTSGSYSQVFDLNSLSFYNPAFVSSNGGTLASARAAFTQGLLSGRTYLNVHTTSFPGGEIRGQLTAVPEPATWAMFLTGFGAVGYSMRSRKVGHKFLQTA